MTESSSTPPPELVFEIRYDRPLNSLQNREFQGTGTLGIHPEGPLYVFQGQPRRPSGGDATELTLGVGDIADVVRHDKVVQFIAARGRNGQPGGPFIFHCRSEAEATEIARLLPARLGPEGLEQELFAGRLRDLSGSSSPWMSVTALIIGLNVAMFIVMGFLGAGWFTTESMQPYIRFAANNGAATTDGEWWRLVVAMFTHYGLMHLALNMWALYQSGLVAERLFGRRLYALVYLASGLTGGLATLFWHGDKVWSAGASGAIFGVIGSLFGFTRRQHGTIPPSVVQSMTRSTLAFVGYNLIYGFAKSGIDNSAHIGGLIGGVAFGWLLALPVDPAVHARLTTARLTLGAGVLAAVLAVGVIFAPRFDYRVRDQIAYDDVNSAFGSKEDDFQKHNVEELNGFAGADKEIAHAQWIEDKMIPFYVDWRRQLAGLSLAPAKQTARLRDALLEIMDLQIADLHHLEAGLRAHNPKTIERFNIEEENVSAKVAAMAKLK